MWVIATIILYTPLKQLRTWWPIQISCMHEMSIPPCRRLGHEGIHISQILLSRKCHYLPTDHPLMDKYSIHEFSAVLFGALKHAIQLPLLNCEREAHAPSNKACNWHWRYMLSALNSTNSMDSHTHTHTHTYNNLAENDRPAARCIAIYGASSWKPLLYHCFPNCKSFQATTDKYDQ